MSTAIAESTLNVTRHIKAPRERVFTAFTSAEAVGQWFGPGPVQVKEITVDFRVGGRYRITAGAPGNDPVTVSGVYREITPPSKIVYTWKWEDDEDWVNCESVVCFEFKAIGDETEVRVTQTGFPSEESCAKHEHGWGGCLDKLDAMLTGQPLPDHKPCC
jgi:uncharacterized protein YndB with AHSA1/START domain